MSSARQSRARLEVLLGALAFAASVPAGKLLLEDLSPLAISGGLYVAAGVFCATLLVMERRPDKKPENRLRGREWWWVLAAVVAGGIAGPVALFSGLRATSGYVAGLLLNFEAVFTIGFGALLSDERVGGRGLRGIGLVIVGAVTLSLAGASAPGATRWVGVVLVVAACACWGLDNNFTQRISIRDARQIVAIKGLTGGAASLILAAAVGQLGTWSLTNMATVLVVGAVSYGLSIVLFIRGLRELGVMHTGALFALAPGFAAILSWLVLREPAQPLGVLALAGMTGGALLLATDAHEHTHTHMALEHAHEHEHDEHHQHEHTPEELAQVPHAHWHRHEPVTHVHPHAHDVHHRHSH